MHKKIILVGCIIAATYIANAQSYSIKLREFVSTRLSEGTWDNKPGKELNTFQVPAGLNALRMYIQIPVTNINKITAKNKIHLTVTTIDKGNLYPIHDWFWPSGTKLKMFETDCQFPAGDYTISLVDADNPNVVFAQRKIVVNNNDAKKFNAQSDIPYDRKQFKIYTCKSIDENWKVIDETKKIKAGSCINLFFESTQKLKNLGMMRWGIFKIDENGKEVYVNQKDQGVELVLWRRLSYEECDEFTTKGHYRIYFSTKDDADAYFGVNNKNYFAKADLFVE